MLKYLKFLIPAVLFVILIYNASGTLSLSLILSLQFKLILISLLIGFLIYPEGAYAWHQIIKRMGYDVSLKESLSVWSISNTSRYIPGFIWQYLGRVELSKRNLGIKRSDAIYSVILESYFSIISSVVISFAFFGDLWLFILVLLLSFLLLPTISKYLFNVLIFLLKKVLKREIENVNVKSVLESRSILGLFMVNFLLCGLLLSVLLCSLAPSCSINSLLSTTGAYSSSWFLGYISFFAPGGLGVSDLSLSFLLSQKVGLALASLLTIYLRLVLIISEIVFFVLTQVLKHINHE